MPDISFKNPENLIFSIFLLAYFLLLVISEYRSFRLLRKISTGAVLQKLQKPPSDWLKALRIVFIFASLLSAVVLVMRPQWGEEKTIVRKKNIDVVFLLDISSSMLALDVKPSRLLKAKLEMDRLVSGLQGQRIALVLFSASSFVYVPFTTDYKAFLQLATQADVDMISYRGTELDAALETALKLFEKTRADNHKILVLLSDGEDHSQGVIEVAKQFKKLDISILSLGIGTKKGGNIPAKNLLSQSTGNKNRIQAKKTYLMDEQRKPVLSKFQDEILRDIATVTGGAYFYSLTGELVADFIVKHIETFQSETFLGEENFKLADRFQLFAFIFLLLLIVEYLLPENIILPSILKRAKKFFAKKKPV